MSYSPDFRGIFFFKKGKGMPLHPPIIPKN